MATVMNRFRFCASIELFDRLLHVDFSAEVISRLCLLLQIEFVARFRIRNPNCIRFVDDINFLRYVVCV